MLLWLFRTPKIQLKAMRRGRILVTGYPAFGGGSRNISQEIVERLANSVSESIVIPTGPRVQAGGKPSQVKEELEVEWVTKLLTCDEAGSKWTADRVNSLDCDAILHIGLCNTCEVPRLEYVAKNILDMRIEDNSGRCKIDELVIPNSVDELISTAPLNRLPFDQLVMDIEKSSDAGSFVCNETYYRTLDAIHSNEVMDQYGRNLPCLFLHLPDAIGNEFTEQLALVKQIAAWLLTKPRIVVACSVLENQNGDFISCRRSPEESFPGAWEFPGGKVERGESLQEAFIRELDEELEVKIEPLHPLAQHVHVMPDLEIELHAWHCRITDGTPKLNVHDAIRELSVDELLNVEWIDADLPMIAEIQTELRGSKTTS